MFVETVDGTHRRRLGVVVGGQCVVGPLGNSRRRNFFSPSARNFYIWRGDSLLLELRLSTDNSPDNIAFTYFNSIYSNQQSRTGVVSGAVQFTKPKDPFILVVFRYPVVAQIYDRMTKNLCESIARMQASLSSPLR